ncbi:restriction endonuclease subunit S [Mycoplasma todarodis]|uniref:Type I restriction modification DNA specificity domain-containing protein n=1 Tax=Mycoplasma todarodis TaxID=1937191 RepID=A0A4R0XMJ8_9MOLU|nr:restriction endonuclease subunit S [Mycoplasma todarodis]TCG11943.1 hypothetical protein C4B25_00365 [Mycoplasma todarodis]
MGIYKLGNIIKIISGSKVLSEKSGSVPVVGSGGIFGSTENSKYNKSSFTLPRKGTMEMFWYDQPIWNVDTAFLVGDVNEKKVIKKYLFYFLKSNSEWRKIITGSTRPATRISDWREFEVSLPSIQEQQKIIDIIEPIERVMNIIKEMRSKLHALSKISAPGETPHNITLQTSKGKVLPKNKGKFRYFNNSKIVSFCEQKNNEGTALIVTTRGTLTTHIATKGWYSTNNIYILRGDGIFSNKKNIEKMIKSDSSGSAIPMITKQNIIKSLSSYNFEIERYLEKIFIMKNNLFLLENTFSILKDKVTSLLI